MSLKEVFGFKNGFLKTKHRAVIRSCFGPRETRQRTKMGASPCSAHRDDRFGVVCWRETVGACEACYTWALFESLKSDSYITWGDIESYRDEYRESLKTPEEKAAEEAAKEETAKKMTVKAHLCHMENAYVNRAGVLKRIRVPCKYFCHKGVIGAPTPGGKNWVAGCEAHLKKLCPAYHPDEKEWGEVVAEHEAKKASGGGKAGRWRD